MNVVAGIILVKDVMTKDVKMVGRDTNMQAVVNMMLEFGISSIVIIQNDKPVGIVTHKDVLRGIVQNNFSPIALTARQVMTTPVTTVDENVSLEEAAKLMTEKKVKKLPVVKNEKLVGIITSMDLVREHSAVIELLEDICKAPSQK